MTWQVALISTSITAILTLIGFFFARNQKASQLASAAMNTMSQSLEFQLASSRLIEKMRTAMYLQSERLNSWEDWGMDATQVMRTWRRYLIDRDHLSSLPEMPKPPAGHLDLSTIFSDEDIKAMQNSVSTAQGLKDQLDLDSQTST